jgi:hypothetical protein
MVSFAVFLALGFVTCLVWETHLTWWAFIIAILISVFFYLPIGIVQATTNVQLGLNVVSWENLFPVYTHLLNPNLDY